MKWLAAAIVVAALIAAGTFIYLDRTRVKCEPVETGIGDFKSTVQVCRDGTGKVVRP